MTKQADIIPQAHNLMTEARQMANQAGASDLLLACIALELGQLRELLARLAAPTLAERLAALRGPRD